MAEFHLHTTNVSEVRKIGKGFQNKGSTEDDMIPMSLIKFCIEELAQPLVDIFNCSLLSGTFPDLFKSAVLTPLHKKGSVSDINNYRPISLLSWKNWSIIDSLSI